MLISDVNDRRCRGVWRGRKKQIAIIIRNNNQIHRRKVNDHDVLKMAPMRKTYGFPGTQPCKGNRHSRTIVDQGDWPALSRRRGRTILTEKIGPQALLRHACHKWLAPTYRILLRKILEQHHGIRRHSDIPASRRLPRSNSATRPSTLAPPSSFGTRTSNQVRN